MLLKNSEIIYYLKVGQIMSSETKKTIKIFLKTKEVKQDTEYYKKNKDTRIEDNDDKNLELNINNNHTYKTKSYTKGRYIKKKEKANLFIL